MSAGAFALVLILGAIVFAIYIVVTPLRHALRRPMATRIR